MITLRKANKSDAQIVAAMERAYIDCPWTESQIAEEIERNPVFFVAELGGEVCGYASGAIAADECEISNIAVSESHRRKGVGKALLTALIGELAARQVKNVFLLVRDGNVPAIALYERTGFLRVGRRANYYKGKDALIMQINL